MITDRNGAYLAYDLTMKWDGASSSFNLETVLSQDPSQLTQSSPQYAYSFPFSFARDMDFQRGMQETIEALHQGHYILYQSPIHGSSVDIYNYYDDLLIEEGVKHPDDHDLFYKQALFDKAHGINPDIKAYEPDHLRISSQSSSPSSSS